MCFFYFIWITKHYPLQISIEKYNMPLTKFWIKGVFKKKLQSFLYCKKKYLNQPVFYDQKFELYFQSMKKTNSEITNYE